MNVREFRSKIVMLGFIATNDANVFIFKNTRYIFTVRNNGTNIDLNTCGYALQLPKNALKNVLKFAENPDEYT